ncbi:MAG: hypothetical protein ABW318_11050 [Vicinamibacterales bacterium]
MQVASSRSREARAHEHDEEDLVHLRTETTLQRSGSEIRLVVAPGVADERPARPDESLIKAVARGYSWYERLVSGEVDSLWAIAKELRVTERYVSRILRCAFLAPDIVEAILEGRQPLIPEALRRREQRDRVFAEHNALPRVGRPEPGMAALPHPRSSHRGPRDPHR